MVLKKLQKEDKFLNQQVKQSTSVDYRIMMKFQMTLLEITGSFKIFMIYKNKIKTKPLSSLSEVTKNCPSTIVNEPGFAINNLL